jgi:hypothetical protein
MRVLRLLLPLVLLAGCQVMTGLPAGQVSCLPVGMSPPDGTSPAPIAFSFPPGPATADSAQATAVAVVRGCVAALPQSGPGAMDPATITSTVETATGERPGPNNGREVWLVRVDAKANNRIDESHYLVEVNKDTGVPTIIGIG